MAFQRQHIGADWVMPDYMTARRLCQRVDLRPFRMRWFTSAMRLAAAFAALSVAVVHLAYGAK